MKAEDIRAKFIDFFREKDHTPIKSASLVPQDDPSLLFNNAGMVQFKRVFTGEDQRDYHRAVTCQKCVRAGGKHNDLENVGYTARHHTFFEMLGNFSFGDYFKEQAIEFGWSLLTEGFGLPGDKMYATVFQDDDEAYDLWRNVVGLPPERIFRLGEKDNFWAMGDTGPCGPCSEILIDQGEAMGCDRPDCAPGCECDRYLELWNLVFMQFERSSDGQMTPLPKPSIDTGMGLERLAAVCQGVFSNFESNLFTPLIEVIQDISGIEYLPQTRLSSLADVGPQTNVSTRVIADHVRALSFLIGDGVLPENVGRGYVLRRILRRAVRHGRMLGIRTPFLHKVSARLIETMGGLYPELKDGSSYIQKVILNEEERFNETLDNGLKILSDEMARLKETDGTTISGDVAFKLYDTYGFPLDLVADVGRENGLTVDMDGFEEAMGAQRAQSRASWKGSGDMAVPAPVSDLTARGFKVAFSGYEGLRAESDLVLIMKDGVGVERAETGQKVDLVFSATPFYGESGGQVGDTGRIRGPELIFEVTGTSKYAGNIIVHHGTVEKGSLVQGQVLILEVDEALRRDTVRNHTATHLLHKILREELGDHVKQSGSMVTPDRLRFDFTHFSQIEPAELARIEARVNEKIRDNLPVSTSLMSMEDAMHTGAMALFEERYGDQVRVVSVGDFSMELCGGTHARNSGDIGAFLILSEASVAAGVRRIEALTGRGAIEAIQDQHRTLKNIAEKLKTPPSEILDRLDKILAENRDLKKNMERDRQKASAGKTGELVDQAETLAGVTFLAAKVQAQDPKSLRELGDHLKNKIPSGVIALGAEAGGKALLLAIVSPDLKDRFHAGNIVKAMALEVGGGGGGRPDMAQAGGPNPGKLDSALAKAKDLVAQG